MRLELVVFDIAGTTVRDDDAVNRCLREALAAGGAVVDRAAVNAVMGLPKPEAIRVVLAPTGDATSSRVALIHTDFVARMRRFYATDPAVQPMHGALDTFAALRRAGIKIGLDTGFSSDITDIILWRLHWDIPQVIDAAVSSDQVARGRPHADMIQRLMHQCDVRTVERVAKVGDTPADLEEGTRAGCALVVGVTGGTHSRAQLQAHPHTHLIESVADMPSLLQSLGAL